MRTLISILWFSFFPLAAAAQGDDLSYRLKKVIKDKKAEIGIAVILDAQDTVTVNNDDRYPLMSVFKFHQALAVADYLDRNGLTPDTEIFIPEEELVPDTYSPLRKEFPEGEISLSVSRLLEYSLQLSDNNACDILFEHTGGPAATDRYVRSLGLCNFAIAATEQQMHDDPQTCYENWSTPLEAAALLEDPSSLDEENSVLIYYLKDRLDFLYSIFPGMNLAEILQQYYYQTDFVNYVAQFGFPVDYVGPEYHAFFRDKDLIPNAHARGFKVAPWPGGGTAGSNCASCSGWTRSLWSRISPRWLFPSSPGWASGTNHPKRVDSPLFLEHNSPVSNSFM